MRGPRSRAARAAAAAARGPRAAGARLEPCQRNPVGHGVGAPNRVDERRHDSGAGEARPIPNKSASAPASSRSRLARSSSQARARTMAWNGCVTASWSRRRRPCADRSTGRLSRNGSQRNPRPRSSASSGSHISRSHRRWRRSPAPSCSQASSGASPISSEEGAPRAATWRSHRPRSWLRSSRRRANPTIARSSSSVRGRPDETQQTRSARFHDGWKKSVRLPSPRPRSRCADHLLERPQDLRERALDLDLGIVLEDQLTRGDRRLPRLVDERQERNPRLRLVVAATARIHRGERPLIRPRDHLHGLAAARRRAPGALSNRLGSPSNPTIHFDQDWF